VVRECLRRRGPPGIGGKELAAIQQARQGALEKLVAVVNAGAAAPPSPRRGSDRCREFQFRPPPARPAFASDVTLCVARLRPPSLGAGSRRAPFESSWRAARVRLWFSPRAAV
jgi:hypothetical protein